MKEKGRVGGGREKLVFGFGKIPGFHPRPPPPPPLPKWNPGVCGLLPCCCCVVVVWWGGGGGVGRGGFCLDVLYHGNANLPYTLCIPLQIFKRANLVRLRPVIYLLSAFYTHFSVKANYTPPLAYLKLRKL